MITLLMIINFSRFNKSTSAFAKAAADKANPTPHYSPTRSRIPSEWLVNSGAYIH